jgi:hypothetical protein
VLREVYDRVPYYTYLQHKMPGPTGTITVETTMQRRRLFYSNNCCLCSNSILLHPKILVVIALDFYVYIQIYDDESRSIYETYTLIIVQIH